MSKYVMIAVAALLAGTTAAVASSPGSALAERALESLVPTNMVNEAAGFFGPVAKKYMPQFEAFEREYMVS